MAFAENQTYIYGIPLVTITNTTNLSTIDPISVALVRFQSFNQGFNGTELASNFTNCAYEFLIWRYWELPTYKIKTKYANAN